MRLAVLSDIHGNPIALDAVLADIGRRGGADQYLVLGDLVAQGFAPVTVMERLAALPNVRYVRGNTDRYVVFGTWSESLPTVADAQRDPNLVPMLVSAAQGFAWTRGALAGGGRIGWLAALPVEQRITLPDGARVLGVHSAPGTDDGEGIDADITDADMLRLVDDCKADVVCVGHTHRGFDRTTGGLRVINVGSVSNPRKDSLCGCRASYAIIESDRYNDKADLLCVPYDAEAVVAAIRASEFFPNPNWLIAKFSAS